MSSESHTLKAMRVVRALRGVFAPNSTPFRSVYGAPRINWFWCGWHRPPASQTDQSGVRLLSTSRQTDPASVRGFF